MTPDERGTIAGRLAAAKQEDERLRSDGYPSRLFVSAVREECQRSNGDFEREKIILQIMQDVSNGQTESLLDVGGVVKNLATNMRV